MAERRCPFFFILIVYSKIKAKKERILKKILIVFGLFLSFICGVFIPHVSAEETQKAEQMGGYTIEGLPNPHQIDPALGYFYLEEAPDAQDELKIKLMNSSAQDKTLLVKVTDANTNLNGVIDYTGQLKNNPLLKTPLTALVQATQKEVVVPKHGEVETTLKLKMPHEAFEGIILGGVVVSEKEVASQKKNEFSISNVYSYTIGIALTNHAETPIKKNVSVELSKIAPLLYDGKKIVQADILNPHPYIFSDAEVSGEVIDLKNHQTLKKGALSNVSIAPYSALPFQLDWKKDELKPGKYLFKGYAKTKENTWHFEKEFEIKSDQAKNINQKSVFKIKIPQWLKIGSILFLVLSVINIVWLLMRKYRK